MTHLRQWICRVVVVLMLIVPTSGYAQPVIVSGTLVSDILNTAENATTSIATAKSALQQIQAYKIQMEQYARQVEQLKIDLQNLKNLNPKSWDDLQRGIYIVLSMIRRSQALLEQWKSLNQSYDTIYGAYGPTHVEGPAYRGNRLIWQTQTDHAYKKATLQETHALEAHVNLGNESQGLEQDLKNPEGHMQAAEVAAKIQSVQMRQQQVHNDAVFHDMRARRLRDLEQRRKAQAERQVQLNLMGRGMGSFKSKARPVKYPEFKSRWGTR